jgi:hypothetical protein
MATRRLYEQVIPAFAADLERRYGDEATSSQRPLRDSLRRVSLQWPLTPQVHGAAPPAPPAAPATAAAAVGSSPSTLTPRAPAVPTTRGWHTSQAHDSAFVTLRERLQSIATWKLHRCGLVCA